MTHISNHGGHQRSRVITYGPYVMVILLSIAEILFERAWMHDTYCMSHTVRQPLILVQYDESVEKSTLIVLNSNYYL